MSNQPQGPGWWQASDGNWYPPRGPLPPTLPTRARSPWQRLLGLPAWAQVLGGAVVSLLVIGIIVVATGANDDGRNGAAGASDAGVSDVRVACQVFAELPGGGEDVQREA